MRKIAALKPKREDLGAKMTEKSEKPFFRMSADNGQKSVRNWCFGRRNGQHGRRKGVFRAS